MSFIPKLDLEVRRSEIFALIGGSGSGKSTLLREMILLHRPNTGSIRVLGTDLQTLSDEEALALRQRWGVMFQHGGLFGSLTVIENVGLPLREHTDLEDVLIDEIAAWKLALTGLKPEVGAQYPRAQRRHDEAGIAGPGARARSGTIVSRRTGPPASDPDSARGVDELVCKLRDLFGPDHSNDHSRSRLVVASGRPCRRPCRWQGARHRLDVRAFAHGQSGHPTILCPARAEERHKNSA